MRLKDEKGWLETVQANQDSYGGAGVRYAWRWADMMESKIAQGESLEDIAEETSHQADTEGITGFLYGCAVSILSQVWLHGEELRRWHNVSVQLRNEGDVANESGGVLNPALLILDKSER